MSKGHSTRPPRRPRAGKELPADGAASRARVRLSDRQAWEALRRVAEGELVRVVCADFGASHGDLYDWTEATAERQQAYRRARELQAHAIGERAITRSAGGDAVARVIQQAIAQHAATLPPGDAQSIVNSLNHALIQRDKLEVDTLRWYASKLAPSIYGDRLQVDATVDQRSAVVVLPPRGLTGAALAALPEAEAVVSGTGGASLSPVVAGAVARLRARTADEGES